MCGIAKAWKGKKTLYVREECKDATGVRMLLVLSTLITCCFRAYHKGETSFPLNLSLMPIDYTLYIYYTLFCYAKREKKNVDNLLYKKPEIWQNDTVSSLTGARWLEDKTLFEDVAHVHEIGFALLLSLVVVVCKESQPASQPARGPRNPRMATKVSVPCAGSF